MATKHFTAISLALLLAACGGGGSGSSTPVPVVHNASPGGIWTGTDSTSGLAIEGLITESGEAHFLRADGAQYVLGTVTITGNSFQATFQGYTAYGSTFPDGSTHGTGTMTGTIAARQTISASDTFTTDAGSVTSGTVDLAFNSLYDSGSSLSTLSGNYSEEGTGTILSINNGSIVYQDATTGCVLNGTVSIIDPTYDAYQLDFTLASCQGAYVALDGVAFSGLATLDNTVTPNRLIVGVTGAAGSASYALVVYFDRT